MKTIAGIVMAVLSLVVMCVFGWERYSIYRCDTEVDAIRSEVQKANRCHSDLDCVALPAQCPFGCEGLLVYQGEAARITALMRKQRDRCGSCFFDCYTPKTNVHCRGGRCVRESLKTEASE